MAQALKLRVKTGEKDGKNFWNTCWVLFLNTDDNGNVTSVTVKHDMFPGVEMAAFPAKPKEEDQE